MSKKILAGVIALALSLGVVGTASASHNLPPFPWFEGQTYCVTELNQTAIYNPNYGWVKLHDGCSVGSVGSVGSEEAVSINSVRGTAYEDLNGNGKRDANEPEMGGAWYKVSNGGDWYVCGWVGKDATYSVPVIQAGMTYFVDAIAPVGWKTTTPRVKAATINGSGGAYLYNDLGFVRDPSVKTVEGCDQYHPVRR